MLYARDVKYKAKKPKQMNLRTCTVITTLAYLHAIRIAHVYWLILVFADCNRACFGLFKSVVKQMTKLLAGKGYLAKPV